MNNREWVLFLGCLLLSLVACTKEEYSLDDNLSIPGLSPSLAIPLANADIGLSELEQPLGLDDEIDYSAGSQLSLTFRERLFEIGLEDLVQLPPQEVQESYEADAVTAAVFNASLPGTELPISEIYNLPFEFENGEELDSIRLGESILSINMISSFRHDLSVDISIPELIGPSGAFTSDFSLEYDGTMPVTGELNVDITDHLLDFTGAGNNNELDILADFIIVHSGEFTTTGDSVYFELSLSSNSLKAAYGYLGQYSGIAEIDTQRVDVFQNIDAESIYFADPAIELDIVNSSGIPMEISFSSLFAPTNSVTQLITGGALEEIPIIEGASFPGDVAVTEHRIDDSNTNPMLSDMLSEGPVDLIYEAEGLTNPNGYSYNFILDTSKVTCDATVILPLFGFVDGYRFSDTLDIDLGDGLGLEDESLNTDDIKSALFRVITDNGLPMETAFQLVFLDSTYAVVDSLFTGQDTQLLLSPGQIDYSLPITDSNHGRVMFPTRTITDIFISKERLDELLDGEISYMVIRLIGSTGGVGDGELVRFYPEDRLKVQLSAKLETEIDLAE